MLPVPTEPHTARPRGPFDNHAAYRDGGADAEAYVCADFIHDHPSCPGGLPYWKVTAVIPDIIGAKRWAGRDGIIVRMPLALAYECQSNRVLPSDLINRAEAA